MRCPKNRHKKVKAHRQLAKKGIIVSLLYNSINTPATDNAPEENSINVNTANINGTVGFKKVLLKCSLLKASSLFQLNTLSRLDCRKRMLKKAPENNMKYCSLSI